MYHTIYINLFYICQVLFNASKNLQKLGLCVNKPDKSAELLVCAI